ncbi:hypothetical protein [Cellulosimicrobium sp. Marseille-Q8652]
MTTSPSTRPSSGVPDGAPQAPDEKAPEAPRLSLTQMIASALAAVSTTVLLSYFGIAGTIIGAGAASIITVVANYAYTRSIQKTHEQLKPVVSHLAPRPRGGTAKLPAVPRGDDTQPLPRPRSAAPDDAAVVSRGSVAAEDGGPGRVTATAGTALPIDDAAPASDDDARPGPWFRLIDRYGTGKVLAVSAAALFVVVMGVVLVAELVIGKPISDAVRGQEGSGTSISRTTTTDDGGSEPGTGTVTPPQELPDSGTTTPSPDPAAPSDDTTEVPTDEPSGTPTEAPTDEPTDPVTPTPEPTEPTEPTAPGAGETGGTGSTGSGTGAGGTDTGADGTSAGSGGSSGGTTGGSAEPAPAPSASVAPGA